MNRCRTRAALTAQNPNHPRRHCRYPHHYHSRQEHRLLYAQKNRSLYSSVFIVPCTGTFALNHVDIVEHSNVVLRCNCALKVSVLLQEPPSCCLDLLLDIFIPILLRSSFWTRLTTGTLEKHLRIQPGVAIFHALEKHGHYFELVTGKRKRSNDTYIQGLCNGYGIWW